MARLSRGQVLEVAFWLAFAVLAYAFSFGFDREIEIYKFGAAGWPRVVIALIVVAALFQLFQAWRDGKTKAEPAAAKAAPDQARSRSDMIRIALVLGLPVAYAALLDISGFYFTTPIFIVAYLWLNGERRIGWLIGVPLGIYCFLLLVFTRLLYVGLPIGYVSPFYEFSNWLLVLIK
ncbi:MAG: tripartite tricarboxylate transporter TctB family protein [Pseudomonadota bacterium]